MTQSSDLDGPKLRREDILILIGVLSSAVEVMKWSHLSVARLSASKDTLRFTFEPAENETVTLELIPSSISVDTI